MTMTAAETQLVWWAMMLSPNLGVPNIIEEEQAA
jgi:hypothetical protein